MSDNLFEIRNVSKIYGPEDTGLVALSEYSFSIPKEPAKIITIAGESGSGKSTLGELLLRSSPPTRGEILFEGVDIWKFNDQQKRDYHRHVQAVFQDPFGVYNPFYRIRHVFDMVLKNYRLASNATQGRELTEEALNAVGLRGDDVLEKYPHQLSGGQRQRIMIARATMLKPKFIVADEPVSMVDASLRASILDVMMKLRDDFGISFLYVTHDLSTAYQIGDQILLLYQGTVAEHGNAVDVITQPKHPYVQLLIDSVPKPDPDNPWPGEIELPAEEALRTPSAKGCRFCPRCPQRMPRCETESPERYDVGPDGHQAACFLYENGPMPSKTKESMSVDESNEHV
ncbi:MAG: ABC transporter ATP-binding protein [Woeseiaceae bacterium]|nr:ABC transporter ATP-binding protein [Woeseiaceae bacterium]